MILLFVFWIILNGRFTADAGMLQIVITGLLLVTAVGIFSKKALDYSFSGELRLWKKLPLILAYLGLLLYEIVKANFVMLKLIASRKPYHPVIVRVKPPLRYNLTRVVFANSVTLTPGTITVDLTDGCYTIHCIDKSLSEGIENCSFVKLLERIEK